MNESTLRKIISAVLITFLVIANVVISGEYLGLIEVIFIFIIMYIFFFIVDSLASYSAKIILKNRNPEV